MKILNKRMLTMIIIILILSATLFSILKINSDKNSLRDQYDKELLLKSNIKSESISKYILEQSYLLKSFSKSKYILNIFNSNLVYSSEVAKSEVEKYSRIRIKELENFLIFNKDFTIKDLKKNEDFRQMVISKISKSGYSGIIDEDNKLIFHPNSELEDRVVDLSIVSEEFLEALEYVKINGGQRIISYTLKTSDNQEKIAALERVRLRTADNKSLIFFTSAVVNDYIVSNYSYQDKFFADKILNISEAYVNLYLISNNSNIIYSSDKNAIGLNLMNDFNINLKNVFESSNNEDFVFHGPYYGPDGRISLIGTVKIVNDSSDSVKYLLLEYSAYDIFEYLENNDNRYDIYFINPNGLLASPLDNLTILSQEIKTESTDHCIGALIYGESENHLSHKYLDHEGKVVTGTFALVENLNLCLITAYSEDSFWYELFTEFVIRNIVMVLVILLIIMGISFFLVPKFNLDCNK